MLDSQAALDRLPATFTPAEATALGLPRHLIYSWRDSGMVVELARGVYRKSDAPETAHLDLLAVTRRAPQAIVCLVSALVIHDLTDEIPSAVQLAVPRGSHPPKIQYPAVEFSRFEATTFDIGRQKFEVARREFIPVYSAERAVADCMRLRHKVGDTVAIRAVRNYLSIYPNRAGDLVAVARQLGDVTALNNTIQVVLS